MSGFLESWRPRPWIVVLALGGILVCTRLSLWQWDRGHQKAAIEESRLHAGLTQARTISNLDLDNLPLAEHLVLQGKWLNDHTVLQDNQTRQGRPGVHVWTAFQLVSLQTIMVNRGWVEIPPDRSVGIEIPPVADVAARGVLRQLPRAGISTQNNCERKILARLNYPDENDIRCALGLDVVPALMLLDADVEDAFIRQWQRFEMPPAKHYAYAFQWAALAVTILILFLRFNRVKPSQAEDAKHKYS